MQYINKQFNLIKHKSNIRYFVAEKMTQSLSSLPNTVMPKNNNLEIEQRIQQFHAEKVKQISDEININILISSINNIKTDINFLNKQVNFINYMDITFIIGMTIAGSAATYYWYSLEKKRTVQFLMQDDEITALQNKCAELTKKIEQLEKK